MTLLNASAVVEAIAGLDADSLDHWITVGWVLPAGNGDHVGFDATDVARVRLILEIREELRIDDESVPVILSLLDQLYATRRALRDVLTAIAQESPAVRVDIKARLGLQQK
jgi:chaperone modulatory protein CbpM